MSENPINVLKRKLKDETLALPKRLKLAKNVVLTHYFPLVPKERAIGEWLLEVSSENKLSGDEFGNVLGWVDTADHISEELKTKLILLTAQYVENHPLTEKDVQHILTFIENDKISPQLDSHINEFCFLTKSLLKLFKNEETKSNTELAKRVLTRLTKYYKDSRKKLELITKILEKDNIETILDYIDTENKNDVHNVCQSILFPNSKKSFFTVFLRTVLQKEGVNELIEEKGDSIQGILKVMTAFYTFPNGRTTNDLTFLEKYIRIFVQSFKDDSQLVFLFYVMAADCLGFEQNYLRPTTKMPTIVFEGNAEKIKRNMLLHMLKVILENEIDVTVKLTYIAGGTKMHIKKTFATFLQSLMMGQLKLEGKIDKTTLEIIKTVLKLDPMLIEQKLDVILPPLMVAKKTNLQIQESYSKTLNLLMQILFKLSRGTTFVGKILPHIKSLLEAGNTEQLELKKKVLECIENGTDAQKIELKILNGFDVFPKESLQMYGKLASTLLFRQSSDLFGTLCNHFEEYCLAMLQEDVGPSTTTLAEVLSSILCVYFESNKMADHTVPAATAEEFWMSFENFEKDVLKKFGKCLLKVDYNAQLTRSYLNLCKSYAQLKLLNIHNSHVKVTALKLPENAEVYDFNFLLPCLSGEQWTALASRVEDEETKVALDKLLLVKITAAELITTLNNGGEASEVITESKTQVVKSLPSNIQELAQDNFIARAIFTNLNSHQLKQTAKTIIKALLANSEEVCLENPAISNHRELLNALVMECLKHLAKTIETAEVSPLLSKAIGKNSFELTNFLSEIKNPPEYFEKMAIKREFDSSVASYIDILKQLQIQNLDENCQLSAIFVLLALKKSADSKKLQKSIDHLLVSIFELSSKYPDVYKLFPIDYIFDFENQDFINLLTLKIKNVNPLFIVKCLLESAVKKVKTDSATVKVLVKILMTNQKVKKETLNIEYFTEKVFQITCLTLPIIAKEKRAITTSAYRSILAELQEDLHKALLKCLKRINFNIELGKIGDKSGNTDDGGVITESNLATLNAMEAFSLTLSKYCETTNADEIQNLECLWTGLEYLVQSAITFIRTPAAKTEHVELSVQLLNVVLRNSKKLETHNIFQEKDKTLIQIWKSIKDRLLLLFECQGKNKEGALEEISLTVKLLCELLSVDGFVGNVVNDLFTLSILKTPKGKLDESSYNTLTTSHQALKYLLSSCLKSNIVERKCVAISKTFYRICENVCQFVNENYESVDIKNDLNDDEEDEEENTVTVVKVDDGFCKIFKLDLDSLCDVITAAKKIPLDYKFIDSIFECLAMAQLMMGAKTSLVKCEVSWQAYFELSEGVVAVLNTFLQNREELLEDRWPCYLHCYRELVASACERASDTTLERSIEERLARTGHSIEKLTQAIVKRKMHISRLAAYTVGDVCASIEINGPPKQLRQHLENSVALLIQASDSTHTMTFLRRELAGQPGQVTLTNMYSNYKKYHKYTGNA
ncbi:uncharacterized protein LOC105385937 [Plutella xylostella]|uniref:uncharacterized protein LOC105385937 n=1 Tax=Plutella xylostella TaxID=51655 RepID=UPI002032F688|nr:uncharacterized protein LOC105385937 [Plutella xylostella]